MGYKCDLCGHEVDEIYQLDSGSVCKDCYAHRLTSKQEDDLLEAGREEDDKGSE